jgi:hypothetical protein
MAFECFQIAQKEATILEIVNRHKNFMHAFAATDEKDNLYGS